MAISYYPDGNGSLWIKDNISPYGTNIYWIERISGYEPNDADVFDFIDNFNDNNIDTTKWFTDGTGTIEEVNGTAHIIAGANNSYPRYVTAHPVDIKDCILEYDVKVTGAAVDSCRIGYTTYYIDGTDLANWYLYIDQNRYINFWTRINTAWALRWKSSIQVTLNTWYKIRFIDYESKIKVQLLLDETVLTESEFYNYNYISNSSIYFGQRSTGDSGYFNNFTIRKYANTEPTITVSTESSGYRVKVVNNINKELRNYQIRIPTTDIGTLSTTSSVYVDPLYKTELKHPYYNINDNCILNIPHMNRDVTDIHNLNIYNHTRDTGRFDNVNNATVFNGTNTRAVISNADDLNLFNTNNFTLILWIKQIGNYTTTICSILSKAANATNNSNTWKLQINKNEIVFTIQSDSPILTFTGTYNPIKINDSQWHMITFVRNTSYIYGYKDGVLLQILYLNNITNFTNSDNLDIGCSVGTINYSNYCNAAFGELVIYDTSFTTKNVLNYYNLTKSKYIPSIISGVQY